jgi:anti-anti-sigma factor
VDAPGATAMSEHPLSSQARRGYEAVHETLTVGVPAVDHMSPFLKVASYPADERTVVVVTGELDIGTDQELQHALREALAQSVHGLDLDLARVDFCDCSGLNVLLHIRRLALTQAKTVHLQAAGISVRRLLALTRTAPLFAHPVGAGPRMHASGQGMPAGAAPGLVEEDRLP